MVTQPASTGLTAMPNKKTKTPTSRNSSSLRGAKRRGNLVGSRNLSTPTTNQKSHQKKPQLVILNCAVRAKPEQMPLRVIQNLYKKTSILFQHHWRLLTIAAVVLLFGSLAGILMLKLTKNNKNLASPTFYQTNPNLTINTNKTHYTLGEKVSIEMTTLDNAGNPKCDSLLELDILELPETHHTIEINNSPICDPANPNTLNSDYTARFTPTFAGEYEVTLNNLETSESVQTSFIVAETKPDYELSRWGPSRIKRYDTNRSPMKIILTANQDITGQLIETVPTSINIIWQGPAQIDTQDNQQTLTWDINLKAGDTKEYTYEYITNDQIEQTLNLGPAKLTTNNTPLLQETQPWRIIMSNN